MKDFIAIDFETANENPSSICSVGAVLVHDNIIEKSFYSLVHPEPDYYKWFCQRVHGITEEDTYYAQCFPFLLCQHYTHSIINRKIDNFTSLQK